jgi:tetratricopeptide (TPR) repeat protein
MSSQSTPVENFKSLLEGASQPGNATRNAWAVRQLLAESPQCRAYLTALGWGDGRLRRLLLLPFGERPNGIEPLANRQIDYGPAFAKAERSLAAFLATGRPALIDPKSLFAELQALPEEGRAERISTARRYAQPEVVNLLIEHSYALRYEDPTRMLHWADLARICADGCTLEDAGSEPRLFDLRAKAQGNFANSLRIGGRMREAEEAFGIAAQLASEGTGDPLIKARLSEFMASLHIFQRRFDRAIHLADEAGRIYRELGEKQLLAMNMVNKAMAYLYSGQAETAVGILNRTIPMIDSEEDPHLLLAACHNLVRCYIDLELPEEALSLYRDTSKLYQEIHQDTLILLRVAWQEGQLLRDLDRLEDAEKALLKARAGFVQRGLAYEVAVVSLDLATVYVKLGFVEEVRQTVTEALPTFRALQVDRETFASLLQLQQVADQEAQALNLIRLISARLEQFPGRFRPQR